MKVIAIASPKGGVGKTTISINLGVALSQMGQRVFLMDLDLKLSGVASQLGLFEIPVSLNDVLKGRSSLYGAIQIHSSGLRIIPASFSCYEDSSLENLRNIINMINGEGFLLIDTPPGFEEKNLKILELTDEIILVINPDFPSIVAGLKFLKLIGKEKIKGVVVNRWIKRSKIKIEYIKEVFGIDVIGVVPEDKVVLKSLERRMPIVYFKPYSKFSISIKKIAGKLTGVSYKESKLEKIARWLRI
ncbi:MAG: AAA family ATPase [Candidatus Aenigmarchaeota archaeon]|nr:AAA family ATPase [Candidatus Aenigmarchaeota archaeon]